MLAFSSGEIHINIYNVCTFANYWNYIYSFMFMFISEDPCNHPGPCDAAADCPCFHNKTYCEKSCRCSEKCEHSSSRSHLPSINSFFFFASILTGVRRYRGCRCKVYNKNKYLLCNQEKCPCHKAGRECDPEVCISCKSKCVSSIRQAIFLGSHWPRYLQRLETNS